MFEAMREPDEKVIRVHRDIFEALEWLGLPQELGDQFETEAWAKHPVISIF